MKTVIAQFLIFGMGLSLVGAQTPDFSFFLYASDSQGNKDTVELGYGGSATAFIDAAFGEVDITAQPFDDDLDLRATLFSDVTMTHSKKHITQWSCSNPSQFFIVGLAVHCANPPLTLSWDQASFQGAPNDCHDFSVIVEDPDFYSFPQSSFAPAFLKDGSFRIYIGDFGKNNYQTQTVNGQTVTVRGLYFAFAQNSFNVVSNDPLTQATKVTTLDHGWQVSLDAHTQWQSLSLYTYQGQLAWYSDINQQSRFVPHSHLPTGLYFLQAQSSKGEIVRVALMKR